MCSVCLCALLLSLESMSATSVYGVSKRGVSRAEPNEADVDAVCWPRAGPARPGQEPAGGPALSVDTTRLAAGPAHPRVSARVTPLTPPEQMASWLAAVTRDTTRFRKKEFVVCSVAASIVRNYRLEMFYSFFIRLSTIIAW